MPPALVGALVGLGLAALYLTSPGRSLSTAAADLESLVTGSIKLSAAQQTMLALIVDQFTAAGLGWLAAAAVANAYAESRLDPLAAGDHGHAIGLFQLNDAAPSAAGYGMSVESRQDPATNTARILEVVRSSGLLGRSGLTNAQWASAFAELCERCSTCAPGGTEYVNRAALVGSLFGADFAAQVPR